MIFYPTTKCPDATPYPIPRCSPVSRQAYVLVGCRCCDVCQKERIEEKQRLWRSRLMAMISHYQVSDGRVVFGTFTVHDDDYPDYEELKARLSKMFNAFRTRNDRVYGRDLRVRYWAVLEYGSQTNRIHAHVFFFVPKEIEWSDMWKWLTDYWTERYKAYIFDSRLVQGTSMAAAYATKYGSKTLGYKNDRTLSSQFGWKSFMEEVKKEWLGIAKEARGVSVWLAVDVPDVARIAHDINAAGIAGRSDKVYLQNKYAPKVVGRMRMDKPVLHPFGACPIYMEGDINSCVENDAGIEILTMRDSLVWVPVGFDLSRLRRSELVKLWRASGLM